MNRNLDEDETRANVGRSMFFPFLARQVTEGFDLSWHTCTLVKWNSINAMMILRKLKKRVFCQLLMLLTNLFDFTKS